MTGPVRTATRARHTRGIARLLAAAVALGLVLAACGTSTDGGDGGGGAGGTTPAPSQADIVKDAAGTPETGGTLRVALEAETDGWDPSKNRWAPSAYIVASAIFDPLVVVDTNFEPKANLAESFTHNDTFTQWEVKLRPNVTFQDGEPLTAAWLDEWFGIVRKSTLTGAALTAIESSAVIDPLTVRVTMKQPWSAFPYIMASQGGYIPSPKMIASPEGSRNPVGTGAFTFKEWVTDKQLTVAKNPTYWRSGMPYLDGIEFKPITDSNARITALKAGDIDLFMAALADPIAQLTTEAQAGNIQLVHSQGDQDANFVMFNVSQPPFDDVRVRQALAYAIDRDTLRELSGTPSELGASSLYDSTSRWYTDPGEYYPYDLDKAKALIDAYKKDKGELRFTFGTTIDPEVQKSTTAITQMWQAAGAQVEPQTLEQTTYITNAVTGKFQAVIWRQFGASDPDSNYVWWIGANAVTPVFTLNAARNQDPQVDAALDKARTTLDQATRKQQYAIVQQRFKELVPYIWLSHVQWTMAASNQVRNIQHYPLPDGSESLGLVNGTFPMTAIWLDR